MTNFTARISLLCGLFLLVANALTAQNRSAFDITKDYLTEHAADLQLTVADITDFNISSEYISKHNGLTHIYLNQQQQGIPVYNAQFSAHISPEGKIIHTGNRLVRNLAAKVNTTTPSISMEQAVQAVIAHFEIETQAPATLRVQEEISANEALFDPFGYALEPIKVKLVYETMADKTVRLAWRVVYYELNAQNWWNARIDALTGEVLAEQNQVIHCSFGKPDATCVAENHKHAARQSAAEAMLTNNAYNVIPLHIESPNHGDHSLQIQPANADASPFGWHDTDGQAGHEFTITRGNNVHAYHDVYDMNSSNGDEPDGGDSLLFDFPYDESNNMPYQQADAAITNLFYWNNIIHDVWYQYGFDEASGNFQANNYGNGGQDGDWVRAEAMDGGGTDNANFGTPEDGSRPRMQMYLWDVNNAGSTNFLDMIVTTPDEVTGSYDMVRGAFGGTLPEPDMPLIGQVVLADDGVDNGADACSDLINGDAIAGNIAMMDRGACQFGTKCLRAEENGAIAVVVCNFNADPPFAMGAGADGDQVTIPVVMISQADCNLLKMSLADTLMVELSEFEEEIIGIGDGPTAIDGDFDNGIITHEYGHGISTRLTGGPNNSGCLGNFEQAGEGWSDFFGLVMTTTSADNAEEGRGIGTYAIDQATTGGGFRPHPYSRNMGTNPHLYSDINLESVPHGVGSVWCVMLWDLYWNMVDEYGFDDDIYNGTGGNNIAMQLVIDGLKLQPCSPTFLDSRDAILAADMANYDGANQCLIWQTFARRGLGVDAQVGGNNNFDMPVICSNTIGIKKFALESNNVEGGTITYQIDITNGLEEGGSNIVITDVLPVGTSYVEGSSSCGGSVTNGVLTIELGNATFGETISCTYQVMVEDGDWTVPDVSDDMEEGIVNWVAESPIGAVQWEASTGESNSGVTAAFAEDIASECDQYLLTEPFFLEGDNPSMSFWHSYDTETDWDGGVVEVRVNNSNWFDLGQYMLSNGYPSAIEENPESPISGREAFHGNSGGFVQTVIDLTNFTGNIVTIRFRFGCDGAVGGNGWYVDDYQLFENPVTATNVACINGDGFDEICDEDVSIVFDTTPNSTTAPSAPVSIAIFPNPAKSQFSVQLHAAQNEEATVRLLSVDGRLLKTQNMTTATTQIIDVQGISSGVYFVEVQTKAGVIVRKVVLE